MSHGYLNRRDEGLTCGSCFASRIQSRRKTGPHPDVALTVGVLPVHALPPIVDAHSAWAARTACPDRATRLSLDGGGSNDKRSNTCVVCDGDRRRRGPRTSRGGEREGGLHRTNRGDSGDNRLLVRQNAFHPRSAAARRRASS